MIDNTVTEFVKVPSDTVKTIEKGTVPLEHTGVPLNILGVAILLIVTGLGYTLYRK